MEAKQGSYGRLRLFSGLAITMALMIKREFSMLLRGIKDSLT